MKLVCYNLSDEIPSATVVIPLTQFEQLKRMLSIALWIRSEQVTGGETGTSLLEVRDPGRYVVPPTVVLNDGLRVDKAREDMAIATTLWRDLSALYDRIHIGGR